MGKIPCLKQKQLNFQKKQLINVRRFEFLVLNAPQKAVNTSITAVQV